VDPRLVGSPEPPRTGDYAEDLAASRGCLLEAGGQVEDALVDGETPVLVGGQCPIALTTLPAVGRQRPDARILWLDAHGDFNTPASSPSAFLGGMALSGACGVWDPGLGQPALAADRLVLCGVRDLDPPEAEALERAAATVIGPSIETLVYLANALDDDPVFVHLDLDVLDPEVMPAEHPADGGLTVEKLYDLLEAVAEACEVVGLEITCLEAPERATMVGDAVAPLLDASPERPSK
jgi:arginase